MANRVQTIRYYTTLQRPPVTEFSGELYVNFADLQIGVLDTSKSPVDFVAIRYYSQLAKYVAGDFAVYNGALYRCIQDTVVGPFDGVRWSIFVSLQEITVLIAVETNRAQAAEQALQSSINTEITNRQNADTNLQNQINNLSNTITSIFPPGMSMDYYGSAAPVGWLLENGAIYNISNYPALGALLGSTYGGNGTTTFAVPNSLTRFGIAAGAGFPLGSMGGSASATIALGNLPSHTHTIQPHTHTGGIGTHTHPTVSDVGVPNPLAGVTNTLAAPGVGVGATGPSYVLLNSMNTGPGAGAITITPSGVLASDAAGGGAPLTTLPPYISRTRVIKT